MIAARFEPDEETLINRRAKRLGMTVSEYLRYTVLTEAVFAGDVGALGLLKRRASAKLRAALTDVLGGAQEGA